MVIENLSHNNCFKTTPPSTLSGPDSFGVSHIGGPRKWPPRNFNNFIATIMKLSTILT